MKTFKLITIAFALVATFSISGQAQEDVKTIKLEQTNGEFTVQTLTVGEGNYLFDISNNGVDHEVGFVLVPKGKSEKSDHIKEAYVKAAVPTGKTSQSNVVSLRKGEYEYFCPLNPTPKYTLIVK